MGGISLSASDLFEQADPERRWGLGLLCFLVVLFLPALLSDITLLFTLEYTIPCVILYLLFNIKYWKVDYFLFSTRVSCLSVCLFPSVSLENIDFLKHYAIVIELCSSLVLSYVFYVDVGCALSLCFHCLVNEGRGESRLYRSAAKLGVFVGFWEMKASVDYSWKEKLCLFCI